MSQNKHYVDLRTTKLFGSRMDGLVVYLLLEPQTIVARPIPPIGKQWVQVLVGGTHVRTADGYSIGGHQMADIESAFQRKIDIAMAVVASEQYEIGQFLKTKSGNDEHFYRVNVEFDRRAALNAYMEMLAQKGYDIDENYTIEDFMEWFEREGYVSSVDENARSFEL